MKKIWIFCFLCILQSTHLSGRQYLDYKQNIRIYNTIYNYYFKDQKDGFFVDIGVYAGVGLRRSSFFEKLGWSGVCFEPNPETYLELLEKRDCIVYNSSVSGEKGVQKFIKGKIPGTASLEKMHEDKYYESFDVQKMENPLIEIPVVCLNTAMKELEIDRIDFLSIDTEGAEIDILTSIDCDKLYIKIISVINKGGDRSICKLLRLKGFQLLRKIKGEEIYLNRHMQKL